MKWRAFALVVIAAMATSCLVGAMRDHGFAILRVRELHPEIWVAWVWFGIPCGALGALIGGLRGDLGLASTLHRALIGGLISSGIAGVVALAPDLGLEVFVVFAAASLSVVGATLGWIAGGGHVHPSMALFGSLVGVLVFMAGVSTFSTVSDLAAPYVLPVGLAVGGTLWVLRCKGVLPPRKR